MAKKISFIDDNGDNPRIYALTATSDVQIDRSATVTKARVETGGEVMNNYQTNNVVITLEGLITDVISPSNLDYEGNDKWVSDVDALMTSKPTKLVTVVVGNEAFPDCVVVNFGRTKSSKEGPKAWRVSLQFEQIQFTDRASGTLILEPRTDLKPITEEKREGGAASTKTARQLTTTFGSDFVVGTYDVVTNDLPALFTANKDG
ncbi:hypothetical protein [Pseudoalteromonas phage J2-1_QLiu-2017]|nr:hypothetical protein [Pseudoalteromonas phage J2-1_QLiu-2017]